MTRICEHCNTEFWAVTRNQKYHNSTCRIEAFKIRRSIEAKDQERSYLLSRIKTSEWSVIDVALHIDSRIGHE